jgi:hypothetical protein
MEKYKKRKRYKSEAMSQLSTREYPDLTTDTIDTRFSGNEDLKSRVLLFTAWRVWIWCDWFHKPFRHHIASRLLKHPKMPAATLLFC